ncbi:MAG: peptidase M50 [Verrucomicrobia bacterium]|nr:peptidase M50 [Verrucomicrobiota bacterium]
MLQSTDGSLPLFRFAGIRVSLHWSWFLVAIYVVTSRAGQYSSLGWNAVEYLSLFCIVLLHEFGHALACRQTGGFADRIILWPLGGIAFVSPPPRPGAHLWSIAAGPLVNVVLAPVLFLVQWQAESVQAVALPPDFHAFLFELQRINLLLLIFNLMPIYPLDGGQMLRSLLWFGVGPVNSLWIASGLGLLGIAGLVGLAVWSQSLWMGIMAIFLFSSCFSAFRAAADQRRAERERRQAPPFE